MVVYTCQKAQPTRCDFFLWDDEAKGREAAVVLNNSRSEPPSTDMPETPTRPSPSTGLITPQTSSRFKSLDDEEIPTPYTPSKTMPSAPSSLRKVKNSHTQATSTTAGSSDEEFYDWPASDDEEMGKAADQLSSNQSSVEKSGMAPPETPRKAAKIDLLSTPGKRRHSEFDDDAKLAWPTPATSHREGGDIFATPSTSKTMNLFADHMPIPTETPTPSRYKDALPNQDNDLASEILTAIQSNISIPIPTEARDSIKSICNRHVMHARGLMKGRDVSRAMVKQKDGKAAKLQAEIEALKSERETDRAVIRHLRREMALRKESHDS